VTTRGDDDHRSRFLEPTENSKVEFSQRREVDISQLDLVGA
jgi:hypothetical protein